MFGKVSYKVQSSIGKLLILRVQPFGDEFYYFQLGNVWVVVWFSSSKMGDDLDYFQSHIVQFLLTILSQLR